MDNKKISKIIDKKNKIKKDFASESEKLEKSGNFEDSDYLQGLKGPEVLYTEISYQGENENYSLIKVHKMSVNKKELGKIKTSLKRSRFGTPKLKKREVSIDKARAEKLALNFFSKRLKSFLVSRMNTEENINNLKEFKKNKLNEKINNTIKTEANNYNEYLDEKPKEKRNNKSYTINIENNEVYRNKRRLETDFNSHKKEKSIKRQNEENILNKKEDRKLILNLDKISNNTINNISSGKNNNRGITKTNNSYYKIMLNSNYKNKNNQRNNTENNFASEYKEKINNTYKNTPKRNDININSNSNSKTKLNKYFYNKRLANDTIHNINISKNSTNNLNINNTINYNQETNRTTSSLISVTQSNSKQQKYTSRRNQNNLPILNLDSILSKNKEADKKKELFSTNRKQRFSKKKVQEKPKYETKTMIKVNKGLINNNNNKSELTNEKKYQNKGQEKAVKKNEIKNYRIEKNDEIKTKKNILEKYQKKPMKSVDVNNIDINLNNNSKEVNSVKSFYKRRAKII